MTSPTAVSEIPSDPPRPWTRAGIADPFPWYQLMLAEHPIVYDERAGVWHIFRFADVAAFLKDDATWSLEHRLESVPKEKRIRHLLTTDGELHTLLRKRFANAYRPKRIAAIEARVREVCRNLLRRAVAQGRFDLVADFATPLTVTLIGELLGTPEEQRAEFQWRGAVNPAAPVVDDERLEVIKGEGNAEWLRLRGLFEALVEVRRKQPQDDLISDLAYSPPDPSLAELGEFNVGDLLVQQLGGGIQTTRHLISSLFLELLQHPAELARLSQTPELVPAAVEEALRYQSPIQNRPRDAFRTTELCGQTIAQGTTVIAWLQAANRDPREFPDPDRFDVGRTPNHQIAFGYGEHFCLGAALARMEARVALDEWLHLVKDAGLAEAGPLQWTPGASFRGLNRLLVDVVPV